ncbi:restriction endonuclease subunit S [Flavobacteriaceae bacterium]|nr:restriction endonuclease subunit S [Flavobacteriaceae bacterium]
MGIKNNMPEGWKITFLSEVTNYLRRGITPKYCENESIFIINQRCIRDNKVTLLNARFHDLSLKDVGDEKRLKFGDILICSTGVGTLGRVAQYKLNNTLATVDSHVTIVRPNDNICKLFLGLLLSGKEREIEFLAEGTTGQTELPRTSLGLLPINLPPLSEQKAIAKVLTAFDDKIELLQAQNKTLETMAQTFFKEWFGKHQIGDELPEGWKVGKLDEVISICGGSTPSTKNPDFWGGKINWSSPKDLSNSKGIFLLKTEKKITKEALKKISSGLLPKGTLLLSSRAPVGYLSITQIELAINQGYIALLPQQYLSNNYMYLWLDKYMQVVKNAANGSTFLEISKTAFRNIECIIPSQDILEKFDKIIEPIFSKVLYNTKQIQSLTKTRDTLLPKLMSGQVRVNNIKQTEDA